MLTATFRETIDFTGRLPEQEVFDADVLIKVLPVNPVTFADQSPVISLFLVPCRSLGNQADGTEIVLPSLRSTLRVSSVTVTFATTGTSDSTVEIRIPGLPQLIGMCIDQLVNPPNLDS